MERRYPDIRWMTVTEKIKSLYGHKFASTVKHLVTAISKQLIARGYRHESFIRDPYNGERILTVFEDSYEFEKFIREAVTR